MRVGTDAREREVAAWHDDAHGSFAAVANGLLLLSVAGCALCGCLGDHFDMASCTFRLEAEAHAGHEARVHD